MRVALYARVSSDKQDVGLSIAAQLRALQEYASRNGHVIVREFLDEAESGRTAARPAFREMISLARLKSPPFQAILVWKLSRFARSREDSIVFKALLRKHITARPSSGLILSLFEWFLRQDDLVSQLPGKLAIVEAGRVRIRKG